MSEKAEITFMQTRLIRLASEEWHLSIEQIIDLFKKADVYENRISETIFIANKRADDFVPSDNNLSGEISYSLSFTLHLYKLEFASPYNLQIIIYSSSFSSIISNPIFLYIRTA